MNNRDISIQIIRIISMLFIVTCHLCNYSTNIYISNFGRLFDVGVFIFFFISCQLYNFRLSKDKNYIFKFLKIPCGISVLAVLNPGFPFTSQTEKSPFSR